MPTTTLMTRLNVMSTASAPHSLAAELFEPASDWRTRAPDHPARLRLRRNEGCHTAVFLRDDFSHDPQWLLGWPICRRPSWTQT